MSTISYSHPAMVNILPPFAISREVNLNAFFSITLNCEMKLF